MQRFELFDFQQRAVEFLEQTPKAAIWSPMGAGKTGMTLTYFLKLKEQNANAKMLVVCPLTVIPQWLSEPQKFSNFAHLRTLSLRKLDIVEELKRQDIDIFILNYENIHKIADEIQLRRQRYDIDLLVYDESSKLKSHSTNRFKAAKILSAAAPKVVLLSATPNPNTYKDLWSQYYLLDGGKRLERYVTHFMRKYFYVDQYSRFRQTLKPNADKVIIKTVSDITMRITETELPDKPELTTKIIPIEFSKKTQAQYKKLERDMLCQLDEETIVTAANAAAKITKCRQYISGFLYEEVVTEDEEIEKIPHHVHDEKINVLKEDVDSFNDEPVIIAYCYRHELDMIKKVITHAQPLGSGMKQEDFADTVKRWNAKQIPVLCCNPASVSHGLNLQHGGNHIIWYSLTYSYEAYTQLIGRLHRHGQQNNVHNHILRVENTMDEVILSKIQSKEQTQQAFLDALYRYRQRQEK
jgi:SNF2 family DNA or RNA helicase